MTTIHFGAVNGHYADTSKLVDDTTLYFGNDGYHFIACCSDIDRGWRTRHATLAEAKIKKGCYKVIDFTGKVLWKKAGRYA